MKVGTDGVLLGAWASGGCRVLDVGTGTGVIALMMAQRFADVTQIRYELEADGARFLQAAAEAAADGRDVGEDTDATPLTDGGYACALEREGYTLRIEITQPDGAGNFEITKWKISKNWDMEDPMDNVWKG